MGLVLKIARDDRERSRSQLDGDGRAERTFDKAEGGANTGCRQQKIAPAAKPGSASR